MSVGLVETAAAGDAAGLAAGEAAGLAAGDAATLGDAAVAGDAAGAVLGAAAALGFGAATVAGGGALVDGAGVAVWHALSAKSMSSAAVRANIGRAVFIEILNILRITADTLPMDLLPPTDPERASSSEPAQAVLVGVTCSWGEAPDAKDSVSAVIVHAGRDMLVLEAADPARVLPPMGTAIQVCGLTQHVDGRLAEHGRSGRFLVSVGDRPVRRDLRLRVSLEGTLRSPTLPAPMSVEIADLTSSGAKVRGVELPSGSQVSLDFTPPGRDESVTVRARVAHATQRAEKPWIGLVFRLVALRGGR